MKPWHLTIASDGRLPLFPEAWRRDRALHRLVDVAGGDLALFCIVDEQAHVVSICDEEALVHRRRGLTRSFRGLAAAPILSAHIRAIEDHAHMVDVFGFVLRQPEQHGLSGHPALWPGNCLVDLLGARLLPGLELRILEALPRIRERDALRAVDLPVDRLPELGARQVRMLGPARIATAAAAVHAANPALEGLGKREVRGRRLACHVARQLGLSTAEIAACLGIDPRAARRLAMQPLDPRELQAFARRLALEELVARSQR